ncbi:MAG: TRAP transporter small permease subunit [Noviherbaspirillum sp.]
MSFVQETGAAVVTHERQAADAGAHQPAKQAPLTEKLSALLGCVFGYIFLALALLVTIEAAARKLFGFSLQGADELGGYALAVGSTLAMCVALIERSHIRIDLIHFHLPRLFQVFLNWLSTVLLAGFALLLLYVCATILRETVEYGSTAPTPWATPLVWPQSLWYAGLVAFALLAVGMALHATWLTWHGRYDRLNRRYGPKVAQEELQEELDDLNRR